MIIIKVFIFISELIFDNDYDYNDNYDDDVMKFVIMIMIVITIIMKITIKNTTKYIYKRNDINFHDYQNETHDSILLKISV